MVHSGSRGFQSVSLVVQHLMHFRVQNKVQLNYSFGVKRMTKPFSGRMGDLICEDILHAIEPKRFLINFARSILTPRKTPKSFEIGSTLKLKWFNIKFAMVQQWFNIIFYGSIVVQHYPILWFNIKKARSDVAPPAGTLC